MKGKVILKRESYMFFLQPFYVV